MHQEKHGQLGMRPYLRSSIDRTGPGHREREKQSRQSFWRSELGLNQRPSFLENDALPTELSERICQGDILLPTYRFATSSACPLVRPANSRCGFIGKVAIFGGDGWP